MLPGSKRPLHIPQVFPIDGVLDVGACHIHLLLPDPLGLEPPFRESELGKAGMVWGLLTLNSAGPTRISICWAEWVVFHCGEIVTPVGMV